MTLNILSAKLIAFQLKHAQSGIIVPLRDIMYGLIYPAVLGTGLVLAVLRVTKEPTAYARFHDSALYVAFASGLFYTFSFTSQSEKQPDGSEIAYRRLAFLVDFSEVILMFSCFYYLGLLDDRVIDPRLSPAYGFILVDVAVIQPLWRLVAGVRVFDFWKWRLVVMAALVAGLFLGLSESSCFHPLFDAIVSSVVSCSIVYYVMSAPDFSGARQQGA
jgi:hypothetical protein